MYNTIYNFIHNVIYDFAHNIIYNSNHNFIYNTGDSDDNKKKRVDECIHKTFIKSPRSLRKMGWPADALENRKCINCNVK